MKNQENEQKAVNDMATGNLAAFERVVSCYENRIWNHLRRITGSPDDATDLTQETFIKLYANRTTIDPSSNFKNWLYRVATNTAYDFLRKKHRIQEVSLDDDKNESETIAPELTYSTKEQDVLVHDLEQALTRILPHYRTILLLYYREGFGYEELAETLDLPLNTVKTHLRRAKQALAHQMQNYG